MADNGIDANGNPQKYRTRTVIDIEGNQREVIDAKDRIVMRYDYDMLGTRIHQSSMEAGERWMLNDASGKPIRVWNSRQHLLRTEYDAMRRPLRSFVQGGDPSDPSTQLFPQDLLYERTLYGDSPDTGLSEPQQRQNNLRGKAFRHFDGAGIVNMERYDFKGNLVRSSRQFATDYKSAPDWLQSPALETETFSSTTAFDAMNRATTVTAPDNSVYRPTFNEANLLDKVEVNLRGRQRNGQPVWTPFVNNIDYNAKGQRARIDYANGAKTSYEYDDKTFRLTHLNTTRPPSTGGFLGGLFGNPNALASQLFKNVTTVQDLHYTYDPVGNITRIQDDALRTVIHNGQTVEPVCRYTYDALYRLVEATGREHIGQSAFAFNPPDGNYRDFPFVGAGQLNDLQAVRNYTEQYLYDPVGNFERMIHQAASGNWTRAYSYNENSLIEPPTKSNRLSSTTLQPNGTPPVEPYAYDAHGNMTKMPHLPQMHWDFEDQLSASSRQVVGNGKTTYYVYDAGGQRVRKITETQTGARKNERFYLGGFEIYREYRNGAVNLVRETLHVMDDKQRITLVETKTVENGNPINSPVTAQRYQFGNHLGSASLELDKDGGLVSYEEYAPYGSTAYQAGRSAAEVSLKRYRYTGKERDEETGFTYHGARYYVAWLGRWVSCDPLLWSDSNRANNKRHSYVYVDNRPIVAFDPDGKELIAAAIGAGVGLVVGIAVEGGRQLYTTGGKINNPRAVFAAGAGGLLAGGIIGLTSGGSLLAQAAGAGLSGAAGGFETRAVMGEKQTPEAVAQDVTFALFTFGVVKGSQVAVSSVRRAITSSSARTAENQAIADAANSGEQEAVKPQTPVVEPVSPNQSVTPAAGPNQSVAPAAGPNMSVGPTPAPQQATPNPNIRPHGQQPSPRPTGTQSHHSEQQTALGRNIANYSPADDPALLMQTPQHRATFAPQAAQRARGAAFERELGTPAALEEAAQIMEQAGVSPATAGQTVMEHSGYLFSTTPADEVLMCLPP